MTAIGLQELSAMNLIWIFLMMEQNIMSEKNRHIHGSMQWSLKLRNLFITDRVILMAMEAVENQFTLLKVTTRLHLLITMCIPQRLLTSKD